MTHQQHPAKEVSMTQEPSTPSTLPDLAAVARVAAQAGADAIHTVLNTGTLRSQFKSGNHDLVTTADRASEAAVVAVITRERPDDAILGEEGTERSGTTGLRWLIDPLDGTANFVHGRADYAVSVGAETHGTATAGAIVFPANGRWVAGGPAGLRTGAPQPHSPDQPVEQRIDDTRPEHALVTFGLPYALPARRQALATIAELSTELRGVRVMGCAAGDLAAVALGQCNAFVGIGLSPWDTAAGQALVHAAGGIVFRGQLPTGPSVIIAGGNDLVEFLTTKVQARAPDKPQRPG
jgi:myo-inositol-1(or 4)-monophosphatase